MQSKILHDKNLFNKKYILCGVFTVMVEFNSNYLVFLVSQTLNFKTW